MRPSHLERIDNLPDVFMLASLCQFKYIQSVSDVNGANFTVSMAGGHYIFGAPSQYDKFIDKYITWLEMRN